MHQRGELILSPRFQRRSVWPPAARSFFIDTLLNGYPVPPLHLRVVRTPGSVDSALEVVDGQQRLRTVFDYLDGSFRLSKSLSSEWAGKKFVELDDETKLVLLDRSLYAFQYVSISDQQVLQIFERFNVHSMPLSAQELRNGKFFGHFKQASYSLAREYLDFWRSGRVFSDASIARMLEVEFVSELLVLQDRGLQDKKRILNDVYEEFDETWPDREDRELRFRNVLDTIINALGGEIAENSFHKRPLFYTLYGAVYHRMYGIPGFDLPSPQRELTADDDEALQAGIRYWSDVLALDETSDDDGDDYEEPEVDTDEDLLFDDIARTIPSTERARQVTASESMFRDAASSQTDNIIPRGTRLRLFYRYTFPER
jgi:hypothetical protein